MLTFKPISLGDKGLFDKYLKPYSFSSCEYSFTSLIIWRNAANIQYAIYKDALIIKKKDFNDKYHFMQPLGYKREDLQEIIDVLIEYKESHNLDYVFKDAERSFVEDVKKLYKGKVDIIADRDNFDYIYEAKKLISLSGKKLHSKKNHYNNFIKNQRYEIKDFTEFGVIEDCAVAAEKWYRKRDNGSKFLKYELEGIKEIIANMKFLELDGMAVYVNDEVEGFTIGEKMSKDLAIIHIEKGNDEINGVYAFINKTFIERYYSDVAFINREEDLGIEGLRKAKTSYNPIKLEEKYGIIILEIIKTGAGFETKFCSCFYFPNFMHNQVYSKL